MKYSLQSLLILVTLAKPLCGQPAGVARTFDRETLTELVRDGKGEVVEIYFSGSADWLVRQEDKRAHWHKFASLKTISLSHTSITKEQLRYIAGLKNVRSLHISCLAEEVELPGSALIALKDMDSLEVLDLIDDSFVEKDWDFLSGLKSLKDLAIRGWITERVLNQILKHEGLTRLSIGGITGEVSEKTAERLSEMKSLETAHFGPVTSARPFLKSLWRNKVVKDLEIVAPALEPADVEDVAKMVNLERLSLAGQQPSAVRELGSLAKLKFLRLSFAPKSELNDLNFLKHYPVLEFLDLSNATSRDPSLESIRGHAALDYLCLPRIVLDEAAIEILESIPKLMYLSVGNAEGSKWCELARKRLPKVRIEATKAAAGKSP
jgi:hypothetical protein